MRVLLWALPMWLCDAIRHGLPLDSGIEVIVDDGRNVSLSSAVADVRPSIVVTGRRESEAPYGGFLPLLREWPALRVLVIGGSASQDAVVVTLIPAEESLGNLSLDALVDVLLDERDAYSATQSTRVVATD